MANKINFTNHTQAGFSLVETIIAIAILTIGLIGTMAAVTYSLQMSTAGRNIGSAKFLIISTFEEIEALKNGRSLTFAQIANVEAVDNSNTAYKFKGFSLGYKPTSISSGADQINGTDDDLIDVGNDKVFGTSDDFENESLIRSGYTRQIIISALPNQADIKKVEVKVRYFSIGASVQEVSGTCYLNDNEKEVNR